MLQIDHIYEFFCQEIFKNFDIFHLPEGVPVIDPGAASDDVPLSNRNCTAFLSGWPGDKKILFYDQEPLLSSLVEKILRSIYLPQKIYLRGIKGKIQRLG